MQLVGAQRGAGVVVAAVCVWALSGSPVGSGTAPPRSLERSDRELAQLARTMPSSTSTTTTTTTTVPTAGPATPDSSPADVTAAAHRAPRARAEPVRDDPVPRVASTRSGAPPVMGRIIVPRLGLDTGFYEGGTTAEIDYGPSHMPRTAHPGHDGNTVFAGHRVTYTAPFHDLDRLQPGDTVTFVVSWGTFTYEFTHHEVVSETDTQILRPTAGRRTATLFTCHPKGSDRSRLVAYFDLASAPAKGPEGAAQPNENYAPADPSATTTTTPETTPPPPTSSTSTSLVLPGRK